MKEAISELLVSHRIFELDSLPHNVNPLSVSVQSSGKKHSILDLRLINKHLWKQSVKFEDLKVALNYLDRGHFLFSTLRVGIIISRFSLLISHFWVFPGFTRVELDIFVSKLCLLAFPLLPTFSLSSLDRLSPTGDSREFTLSYFLTMV